jgi:hypothetical protein
MNLIDGALLAVLNVHRVRKKLRSVLPSNAIPPDDPHCAPFDVIAVKMNSVVAVAKPLLEAL